MYKKLFGEESEDECYDENDDENDDENEKDEDVHETEEIDDLIVDLEDIEF